MSGTKQKIEHMQEEPMYKREYLFLADTPVFLQVSEFAAN